MPTQDLASLIHVIAAAIRHVDSSAIPYKSSKPPYREYSPGVGPYSETSLCQQIVNFMNSSSNHDFHGAVTKRTPDVLIPSRWAIELKIARPFGDNGKEAEHWSQNLLHPYPGNTSSVSDGMKLSLYSGPESRAIIVVGYEHAPARISLDPLVNSFELIATQIASLRIGPRQHATVDGLIHPHHQVSSIWGWMID